MAFDDRTPSAGRFTRWAILLVLPLVLAAAGMPWLLGQMRAARHAVPATLSHAPADDATGGPGTGGASFATETARHPEAPTTEEIEAARATAIEAGRLQQRNLAGATTFAPRQASVTPDGERVAPFQGFGLSIDSTPPGAGVRVDGRDVGQTPIVTSVDCAPGREVEVALTRRGYRPARRTVRCRADALVEVGLRLDPVAR